MSADLLGLFEAHGLKPKKKTAKEWGAACPACGGTDRCMVRPEDHDGRGGYHCRQCGIYGDNIQFLRDFEGLTFQEACRMAGVEASRSVSSLPKPPRKAPGQDPFEPSQSVPPSEKWAKQATAFAARAHQNLLNNPKQLSWLAARGLPVEAVKRYRLGWNPGERGKSCLIRPRSVWGIPLPEAKEGDRPKTTFWIPRGLVIPTLDPAGNVLRLRIRRPEEDRANFKEETKYYVIPGSCMDAMILGSDSRAFVVVESELDALMLHYQVGDLSGAVSVMTSTVKKIEASVLDALSRALCILVALDFDGAGAKGWERWEASLPRSKRWPCPVGKDPGEAFAQGANLRAWVLAGMPPVLQPGLLSGGLPVVRGKEAPNTSGPSANDRILSTGLTPKECATPEVSTALPGWLQPLTADELEAFGSSGEALAELTALMDAYQAMPFVLIGKNGDRGMVLHVPDSVWLAGADPSGFEKIRKLFFGECLETILLLTHPKKLTGSKSTCCCHGLQDGDSEWAMLVKNDDGLSCVGWRRLDLW